MTVTPESIAGPSEASQMKALFCWAAWNLKIYPQLKFMAHIPNGGSRDVREGANLKAQGVKRGIPDIGLFYPNKYAGLFIEMKIKSGNVSADQQDWLNFLNSVGYKAVVCYGWIEARDIIVNYLENKL